VTAARAHNFYAQWGVPDTVQGRFEMIALHVALALRRLDKEGAAGRRLGLALTEAFVVDMDDTMREMTFGDLAVPGPYGFFIVCPEATPADRLTVSARGAQKSPRPAAALRRTRVRSISPPRRSPRRSPTCRAIHSTRPDWRGHTSQ
jgi:hypothetical protein